MQFNDIIKKLRIEKNLLQKDVAKELKIAKDTYGAWERGNNQPPLAILIDLANFYKVSLDYLLGRENEDYTKNYDSAQHALSYTDDEQYFLGLYRSLIPDGKQLATKYLENMQEINAINKFFSRRK